MLLRLGLLQERRLRKIKNLREDINYDDLYHLYHNLKLSIKECGVRYGLSLSVMYKYFKFLGVETETTRRQKVEDMWNYKGGRTIDSNGYIILTKKGHPMADNRGRIYEHRFVMSEHIGRYLLKEEEVHHKNGIVSDNKIDNLILLSEKIHKSGHLTERTLNEKKKCLYEYCNRIGTARGLCDMHYLKHWQNGTLNDFELTGDMAKEYWRDDLKKIFLFVGESGCGKTEITKRLISFGYKVLESYTTREKRVSEDFGHIFCSIHEFEEFKRNDEIAAYTFFDGHHYFSTKEQVYQSDTYVIDPDGIVSLKNIIENLNYIVIYLKVDEKTRRKRMYRRGDSLEQIERRILNDNLKFKNLEFDYCIPNKRIMTTFKIVKQIMKLEKDLEKVGEKELSDGISK